MNTNDMSREEIVEALWEIDVLTHIHAMTADSAKTLAEATGQTEAEALEDLMGSEELAAHTEKTKEAYMSGILGSELTIGELEMVLKFKRSKVGVRWAEARGQAAELAKKTLTPMAGPDGFGSRVLEFVKQLLRKAKPDIEPLEVARLVTEEVANFPDLTSLFRGTGSQPEMSLTRIEVDGSRGWPKNSEE